MKRKQIAPPTFLSPLPGREISEQARDAIIEDNIYLVHLMAQRVSKHLPQLVLLEDLIAAGWLGLIDAADKYRPDQFDVRFHTYAQHRIRGEMHDYLRTCDYFKVRSLRRYARRINQAEQQLSQANFRFPTSEEMAAHLKIEIHAYYRLLDNIHNLETVSVADTEKMDSEFAIFAPRDTDPDSVFHNKELRQLLQIAVLRLPKQEQQVIHMATQDGLSAAEIGAIFGVTESRICQIQASALVHIRSMLRQPNRSPVGRIVDKQPHVRATFRALTRDQIIQGSHRLDAPDDEPS